MSTIGERIAQLRLHRGMTMTELADKIGETIQTVYKYEKGIVTNIPLVKIEAIAKALRCPPVALTGWEDPSPAEEVKSDPTHEQLLTLFDSLSPDAQRLVLDQLKGAVLAQQARDTDPADK